MEPINPEMISEPFMVWYISYDVSKACWKERRKDGLW
jgi:hypothetical protein